MREVNTSPRHRRFAVVGAGATSAPRFLTVSAVGELGVVLALSVLFPFLIHILPVPDDVRLGPRLLPMFYAPLLASLLGRPQSALAVALLAPWLNRLLTGHPLPLGAVVMMVQLVGFVAVLRLLWKTVGPRWFLAAPAYFLGLAASMMVAAVYPDLLGNRPLLIWASGTVTMALPGIAILVFINWLVLSYLPPDTGGNGPVAA